MHQRPILVPELACSDLDASLAFYIDLLQFSVRYARPENRFAYLERAGGIELMLSELEEGGTVEGAGWNTARLEQPFGRGINLQIEIDDVDSLHERVGSGPWPVFLALHDAWYRANEEELGNRQFIVLDPDGYQLRFFTGLGGRPATGGNAELASP